MLRALLHAVGQLWSRLVIVLRGGRMTSIGAASTAASNASTLGASRDPRDSLNATRSDSGPRVPSIRIANSLVADVSRPESDLETRFRHPRVCPIPAVGRRLQLRATATVLSRFAVTVIPWPLAERLLKWDAPYALADFCRDLNIDFGALLSPSRTGHETAVERLRDTCELLVAAEQASQGSGLSLAPFLESLRDDVDRASAMLDSLAMLSQALRLTNDCKLTWRVFVEHRAKLANYASEWHLLSAEALNELCEDCYAYRNIDQRVEEALDRIAAAVSLLQEHQDTADLATEFVVTRDGLQHALETGAQSDPNEATSALETLAEVAESAVGEQFQDDQAEGSVEEIMTHHLAVLDLTLGASWEEIRMAHRKLMNRWHPDRHPEARREEAGRRTGQINASFDELRRIMNSRQAA